MKLRKSISVFSNHYESEEEYNAAITASKTMKEGDSIATHQETNYYTDDVADACLVLDDVSKLIKMYQSFQMTLQVGITCE